MGNNEGKAREQAGWNHVAAGWEKYDWRITGSDVSDTMFAAAQLGAGHRVLDIACGTGQPAIPAAQRVGPTGSVLAVDYSEGMLAVARRKAEAAGLTNIEFRQVDGDTLTFPEASFDVVLSRWGINLFDDPVACMAAACKALKPGGRVVVTTWGPPDKNPWASIPIMVFGKTLNLPPPPKDAPGLFALGQGPQLEAVLKGAGFSDVVVESLSVDPAGEFDSGDEYFTFSREVAGPVAVLYQRMSPEQQKATADEIARQFEGFRRSGGKIVVPAHTWMGRAVKA